METVDTGEFHVANSGFPQGAVLDSAWGLEVGLRVRELRMQRDLTQQELAHLADLSISSVSRLERGDRPPTIRMLRRLAVVFSIKLQELLGIEET
ncbi:MAG: helix-turn-helix domain-containing protein [Thermomicrobiales bacterium]